MNMAHPIQILEEKSNGFALKTNELFKILDNLSDKNIAIVSINGNKRTGKSFLLNFILRYLYSREDKSGKWVYDDIKESFKGFEWRGGPDRHTVGIWLWSEPFIITDKNGSEVALLLLDTQGNFDEKTTLNECAIIFALSAFLSSTIILNVMRDISEDKLQFVELFASFAESFSGDMNSMDKPFQRLMILVRDWENECWNSFGCHDDNGPELLNYKKERIDPNENQCKEAQSTREQILSLFDELKCFLLPHPGKNVSKDYFSGQTELIDEEFIDYLKLFVPLVVGHSNIEAKKLFGEFVTGNSLKAYLTKWSDIIDTENYPDIKTLASAAAHVNQTLAFKEAMSLYESKISDSFDKNPTDEEFLENHKAVEAESIDYFLKKPKGHITEEKKNEFLDLLSVRINQIFEVLRSSNISRIDKENAEQALNSALESHHLLEERLNMQQQTEGDVSIKWFKISLNTFVKYKMFFLLVLQFIILIAFGSIMISKLNDNKNHLKTLQNNLVPIGFIYFQLPGQKNASSIWQFGEWADISFEYSGLYFRVLGNGSQPFGVLQDQNTIRLTSVKSKIDDSIKNFLVNINPGVWSDWVTLGSWKGDNVQTSFLLSAGEVTPRNKAIRIWKRIK